MKIGSDAVLMGSLLDLEEASEALEIGTGTGVISLMLAQRYPNCHFMGMEIDPEATQQCEANYQHSPFASRLQVAQADFGQWQGNALYDHIFSNPPYYLNAHTSGKQQRDVARHASTSQLEDWLQKAQSLLKAQGKISLILPPTVLEQINIPDGLHLIRCVNISSFPNQEPVRLLLTFATQKPQNNRVEYLPIYQQPKEYSEVYRILLQDFLIIF
jgi:tRNA1Val (adenine37-N6)-methyltransferase